MKPIVYFFTSTAPLSQLVFSLAAELYPTHDWRLFRLVTKAERVSFEADRHSPQLIVSFLNPYILPGKILDGVEGRAYNIHPATPDYPGRDPQHFAFYDGSSTAGATLHRMEQSVDSGEILDVAEKELDRAKGVDYFIEQSQLLSIVLLLRNLPALLDDTVKAAGRYRWRMEQKRSRNDFLKMCKIEPDMDAEEIRRRIEAFSNPAYRNIYVDINGYRFKYEPADQ